MGAWKKCQRGESNSRGTQRASHYIAIKNGRGLDPVHARSIANGFK